METNNNSQVPETTDGSNPAAAPEATPEKPACGPLTQAACDIAAGHVPADPAAEGFEIIGAKKDLNCKGRGPQWYRLVWRGGKWVYIAAERLPSGSFRAAERRAEVHGTVYPGEIVVSHDRGGPLNAAWLARAPDPETDKCLVPVSFAVRRDGQLRFTLPDGSEAVLPNPRKR